MLNGSAGAGNGADTGTPAGFFTNLASRLLQSELNVPLERIPLYPTNQYTPAVHRLLQVTANLYDATTNVVPALPHLPSVFRPVFGRDADTLFISGYDEVTNAAELTLLTPQEWMDAGTDSWKTNFAPHHMAHGIPLIIGVKKGLPNFNKFAMETAVTGWRAFVFQRPSVYEPVNQTNQIFRLGISNTIAVETWNSYTNEFTRPVQMRVEGEVILCLTNEFGVVVRDTSNEPLSNAVSVAAVTNFNSWSAASLGLMPPQIGPSFRVPVHTNLLVLTNSTYRRDMARFLIGAMDPPGLFPVPRLWLTAKVRLRYMLIDTEAERILDYVNLEYADEPLDIADVLSVGGSCNGVFNGDIGSLFCTNRLGNPNSLPMADDPSRLTYGMKYQFDICMGNISVLEDFWRRYSAEMEDMVVSQNRFRRWLLGPFSDSVLEFRTPLNPYRTIRRYVSLQANDPLLHHRVEHLTNAFEDKPRIEFDYDFFSPLRTFDRLNDRYRPWGGNPTQEGVETEPPTNFDSALKDPVVTRSDNWNFPANTPLSVAMIGRVHRGTPWQTIYLKSAPVDACLWSKWSGIHGPDALVTMPTNDWRLVSLLGPMLNTNPPHALLSLNDPRADHWLSTMDGLTVLTNTTINPSRFRSPTFDAWDVEGGSPQAALMVDAIQRTRAAQPGGRFAHIGALLAAPELTLLSPWLDRSAGQVAWGISDEAYEALPSQLLPRLRPDWTGTVTRTESGTRVGFTGFDGHSYAVQVSSNLTDWINVSTNVSEGGGFEFNDPSPVTAKQKFYRTLLLP